MRDLEDRWRIGRGQARRFVLLHPSHHLADGCAAGKELIDEHVEDIRGGGSFLIGHTFTSLGAPEFTPLLARSTPPSNEIKRPIRP